MSQTEAMEPQRGREPGIVFCPSRKAQLYFLSMQSHSLPYYDTQKVGHRFLAFNDLFLQGQSSLQLVLSSQRVFVLTNATTKS